MLACSHPGWGPRTLGVNWGKCLPTSDRRRSWRPPVQATPEHPFHPACPASSLPPEALTISQEVGGRAEGPRGQVPGQPLQLAQQAFQFSLQVLHRLLHRLEQERWEWGGVGQRSRGRQWCPVLLSQEHLVCSGERSGLFLFSLRPSHLRVP